MRRLIRWLKRDLVPVLAGAVPARASRKRAPGQADADCGQFEKRESAPPFERTSLVGEGDQFFGLDSRFRGSERRLGHVPRVSSTSHVSRAKCPILNHTKRNSLMP